MCTCGTHGIAMVYPEVAGGVLLSGAHHNLNLGSRIFQISVVRSVL